MFTTAVILFDIYHYLRFHGRDVNHEVNGSIEDGLGVHATNMNPLIGYEQTPPSSIGHDHHRLHSISNSYTSSQFTPRILKENNLRRCITMNSQPLSSTGMTTVPVNGVLPEYRKSISTSRQQPPPSSSSRYSSFTEDQAPTTVMMRGRSIDKPTTTYSEISPRTRYAPQRHMSTSHIDFFQQDARRRQSLQPLNEAYLKETSAITGSQYSHPRKPTSVVALPTVISPPIQTQAYSSESQFHSQNGFGPTSPFTTDRSSTPRQHHHLVNEDWPEPSPPPYSSTTFGTDVLQNSTTFHSDTSHVYTAEAVNVDHQRRQSSTDQVQSERASDDYLHSPMSNSGNSNSSATTTTTSTVMPTIFSQNGSNKIAVAPQPQKKSSHRPSKIIEDTPRFRNSTNTPPTPSPYQLHNSSTSSIPTSRSAHRFNRLSNEVFVDGPPPLTTPTSDGYHDAARFSMLEDKVHALEHQRQNVMFNTPSEAQRMMMEDLLHKNEYIGRLEAQNRGLAAKSERQQMEYDEEKYRAQKDFQKAEAKYLALKKKCQSLNDQLETYERTQKEKKDESAKELSVVKEQIRLRDIEIAALRQRLNQSIDGEALTKLKDTVKAKESENAQLQEELATKKSKIKELEMKLEDFQDRLSQTGIKPSSKARGHEVLTEFDTDDDQDDLRASMKTPTSMLSLASTVQMTPTDDKPQFSSALNHLIRTNFRRTQICNDLSKTIVDATEQILSGRTTEAGKTLGCITDTEADDSEAIESETSLATAKMSMVNLERYLKKGNNMLDDSGKKLTQMRSHLLEFHRRAPYLMSKNSECRVQ